MQHAATPHFSSSRLREAAEALELTQQDVAFRLGISMRAASSWFRGEQVPGGKNLIALARLLERDAEWFFEESGAAA